MNSPAWARLKPVERCVWLEAVRLHNGTNNGYLALASRSLAERIGVKHTTVVRALQTLVTLGFIEVTRRSDFSKKRRATEYRLTHVRCDRTGNLASKEFMHLGKRMPETSAPIVTSEDQHRCMHAPMRANRHMN
jgi:DNA-binding IclR family transcriptional regulator